MSPEGVLGYQDLLSLVESGKELAARVELNTLLKDILERAQQMTDSEGSSILLEDERKGGLYFAAALGDGADTALADYGQSSTERVGLKSKAGTVFLSGKSLVEESVELDDDHFKGVDQKTGIVTRRLVCVAMSLNDQGPVKRIGVLEIINKRSGPYCERDRVLLEHFAAQAAIAIRNGMMVSNLVAHMGFYARSAPAEIMRELNDPPRTETLTVMFADMRGFTRLCQTVRNDRKIYALLTEFMTMLADGVLAHGGMVNKKMGDGILALFRNENTAQKAVECSFSIVASFEKLHAKWTSSLSERIDFLDVGIGIATDEVMLGTMGTGSMRDFTAIGTPVILAAALEKDARGGKRILSDRPTYFAVRDIVTPATPDRLDLHKPDQPVITSYDVYRLTPRIGEPAVSSEAPPVKAFLCHASDDDARVCELYNRLKGDRFQPWLDKFDLQAGEEWAVVIPNAVRASDVVLVCMSCRSITKEGYLQKELRHVLDAADEKPEGAIFVIPVRLEDCDIPQRLRRWQWVDLFEADGYEKLVRALRARGSGSGAAACH